MTQHEVDRIVAILDVHAQQMNDPAHRLLCSAEPCAIALLLRIVSRQSKALARVGDIAETLMVADAWRPRRGERVDAAKTVEVLDSVARTLAGIVGGTKGDS